MWPDILLYYNVWHREASICVQVSLFNPVNLLDVECFSRFMQPQLQVCVPEDVDIDDIGDEEYVVTNIPNGLSMEVSSSMVFNGTDEVFIFQISKNVVKIKFYFQIFFSMKLAINF